MARTNLMLSSMFRTKLKSWLGIAICIASYQLVLLFKLQVPPASIPNSVDQVTMAYPKVYVVPLPPEWNRMLLENSTTHNDLTSIEQPFGPQKAATENGKLFYYTDLSELGEYDADVYFHNMMEGYIYRVKNPEEADLFYVPIYWRRRIIENNYYTEEKRREAVNLIQQWIEQHPPKDNIIGPNFFTVQGSVCSCPGENCSPMPPGKLRVGSWEAFQHTNQNHANLIMPYMSQVHGTYFWDVDENREHVVLAAFGQPVFKCIICGLCPDTPFSDQCNIGCDNMREEIINQVQNRPDVLYLPLSKQPDSLLSVFGAMLSSDFCLQPSGDTLSRKSFFDSILMGCIPVVFRNDEVFLSQLPFSQQIPYRKIFYYIPEDCVTKGDCGSKLSFIDVLHSVSRNEVILRRKALKKWGRKLSYSTNNTMSGYNNIDNADAFMSTLQQLWQMSQDQAWDMQ